MAMILNNFFRDHNLGATKLSDTKPRRFNTTTKNSSSLITDLDNKYKKEKYIKNLGSYLAGLIEEMDVFIYQKMVKIHRLLT
jgi:hypothetical protein